MSPGLLAEGQKEHEAIYRALAGKNMHEISTQLVPFADFNKIRRVEGFDRISAEYPTYLTDESKLSQYKAEIEANEMEIATLSCNTTKLQEQIDQLKGDNEKLKEELHKFQANIAAF